MITKAVFTLFFCIPFTVITETYALRVSFTESDSSVSESDGSATVRVTKSGLSRGDVLCTLIPLSLDEARIQFGYVRTGSFTDPAEIDMDFSPALVEHIFEPGQATVDETLGVKVVDDEVFEQEELLLVRLNVSVSDPQDEAELEIGTQYLELRILVDSRDEPTLREESKALTEGDGLVEDFFVVTKVTESELPISFGIKVLEETAQIGVDYELEIREYTIYPNQSNVTIPLTVLDDDIAEETESFTFLLLLPQTRATLINIRDNDIVIVKVGNSSEIDIEEGESATICAEIVSPAEVDREANTLGSLMGGSATAGSDFVAGFLAYELNGGSRRVCQVVQTVEDEIPEPNEFFSTSLFHFDNDPLVLVEPSTITFNVTDDDVPELQVTLPGNDQTALSVIEGETHTINVSIPGPNLIDVHILVAVSPDTAEKDADFVISVGTFTLRPGTSSLELPLSIPDDLFVENNEHWTLIISHSTTPPHVIPVTIIDNDPVTVGFVNDSRVTVGEGEEVKVCGKMADATPSLLQRDITLEGTTVSGTAIENSDFIPLTWTFTFSSSSPALLCVAVTTIDDLIGELPEEFSLVIMLATAPEPLISVDPSTIRVLITNDDIPELEVELAGGPALPNGSGDLRAVVKEGDGVLDKLIRIYSPGVHAIPLEYHVSITPSSAEDITVTVGTFTIPPSMNEMFLPVSILDDSVAEDEEEVSILIRFNPGTPPQTVTLIIQDNDEVVVSGIGGVVEEGGVATVCSCIVSPRAVDRTIAVLARTVSLTATADVDYTPVVLGLSLNGTRRTECFEIQTFDNDRPNHPLEFEVRLEISGQSNVRQERDSVTVTITDDDGTPLAPVITGIKLLESDRDDGQSKSNLTFSWKVTLDELRPVDFFTGTLTLRGVRYTNSSSDGSRKSNGPVSKSYNFTVDGNTTTEYTVVDVEPASEYTVTVCSWNSRGSNCSLPGTHSSRVGGVKEEEEGDGLPAGVIVSIVLLVVFVLVCCCLCCLCFCLCCCKLKLSDWISYHPEKREKKYAAEYKSYREYHTWQGGYKTQSYHTWQGEIDSDFDSDLGDEV